MLQILTYSIRTKMSEAETMLWRELLKDKKMLGYCFNRRIELHDHDAAFLCLELRLIIEIDNTRSSKHENRLRLEKELFFRQRGYYVLRFFENEILSEMEKVRSIIKEWILFNAA